VTYKGHFREGGGSAAVFITLYRILHQENYPLYILVETLAIRVLERPFKVTQGQNEKRREVND